METMTTFRVACLYVVVLLAGVADFSVAQDAGCPAMKAETATSRWFFGEVWSKVASVECIKCHRRGGDAEDSRLILKTIQLENKSERAKIQAANFAAFCRMARLKKDGQSLLLQKVVGKQDHGGEQILKPDSSGYRILQEFVRRTNAITPSHDQHPEITAKPFFDGVTMLDNRQLLRRATLSLAGRLPTDDELRLVQSGGSEALTAIIDQVTREEAFYERLREGFNDIFLLQGVDGNPDSTVLSYEHFEKTRLWYQKYDLSHIEDEQERRQAEYRLAREYRAALLSEPMRLLEYIVRNNRPFTEIVTADYIMVSPYTARGYGVFDELKETFTDPKDPFEFIPVRLKALTGRNQRENQDSATGFYPHAGLLSTFQYLSRYPTTETNRNRLRARMYFLHFLGIDILELAARGSDAAAATTKYEIPTMQASECVVCHRTLDPVAGIFQDYWRFDRNFALYGKRKEGWFTDMFGAGFDGEELPATERWRALQWLGERTAKDPRFAIAMTEHAYFLLTGRRPLLPPKDIDDPLYTARQRAWQTQRGEVESIARTFVDSGFNFRTLIGGWIQSDFYRADGLTAAATTPERKAELDDVGVVRMLSPEQLERKIKAVFGRSWGRLNGQTAMLYGGIDSKEVTERATDPGGAMGSIQRTLANDVACRNVALDFSRPPKDRLLFPSIDPNVRPGKTDEGDATIRRAIVRLHERILGRYDAPDSTEVNRTFELFAGVVADASARKGIDPREAWSCRQGLESPVPDEFYTVRAWRAVLTYLLRREEFLYE